MLALTRQRDQVLVIRSGDVEISIMVVDVRGDKVRLGIEAPPAWRIDRKEVAGRIDKE